MRDLLRRTDRLDAERIAVLRGLPRLPCLSAITTSGRAGTRARSATIIAAGATTALRPITGRRTIPTLGPVAVRRTVTPLRAITRRRTIATLRAITVGGTVPPLRTLTRRRAFPALGAVVRRAPSGRSSAGRTALGRTATLLRATTGGTIP
ncbi:hypothetical protein ASG28_06770 [Frigoribacterium sp. Leaf415]|nr:hypothetical protein ASF07_06770 [Frigoribacterium sp. Leaf254]KQT39364.1 hypothetical protein ASG28_06770 [Frigoribacterium sp. Leaf415]